MTSDFRRIYGSFEGWGVKIRSGMKMKDLPKDIRIASEPHEGALAPISFENGKFVHKNWGQSNPLYYPTPVKTVLEVGDYIVELPCGGIGYIRGSS